MKSISDLKTSSNSNQLSAPRTDEVIRTLLAAQAYSDFLKDYFKLREDRDGSPGFSSFARRAGFRSRSFPREVVLGLKRITMQSLDGFVRGIGLEGEAADLFRMLVISEEGPTDAERHSSKQRARLLRSRLEREFRTRSLNSQSPTLSGVLDTPSATELYASYAWPFVYAALGTQAEGATLAEIASRSGLAPSLIEVCLKEMTAAGAVVADSGSEPHEDDGSHSIRFRALDPHVVFKHLTHSLEFKAFVSDQLYRAGRLASNSLSSREAFFFHSAASMRSSQFPESKNELRDVLHAWIDKNEDPVGDGVWSVVVAVVPSKSMFSNETQREEKAGLPKDAPDKA